MDPKELIDANLHWNIQDQQHAGSIFDSEDFKRTIFADIEKWIYEKEIIVIHGLRRTGKTVLLSQIAEKYRRDHQVKNKHVLFYSFESEDVLDPLPETELKELLDFYFLQILNKPHSEIKEPTLLVLDEIQNVKNWSRVLKQIYDSSTHVKILISGSASLFIESESESLAGRMIEFALPTLSFHEFCALQSFSIPKISRLEELFSFLPKIYTGEIKNLFETFLLCGGFPQTALQFKRNFPIEEIQRFIRDQIIKKIVTRDLKRYYKIANTIKDWKLVQILAEESGKTININKLSSDVGYSPSILTKHLEILEQSYLTRNLAKFNTKRRRILNGKNKFYLRHPSIIMSLLSESNLNNPNLFGHIVESYLAERLPLLYNKDIYYAQDERNREIDFYLEKEKIALEVKTSGDFDLEFLKEVAQKFKIKPIVVSLTGSDLDSKENIKELAAWSF